jgi:galactose mutarotase-like enzyme
LQFNKTENAGRWPLTDDGLIDKEPTPFLQNEDNLPLKKELFYKDALVFKDLQSKSISIVSDKTEHGVKVEFDGFPYMGIWAAKDADFVCIEPWCGIADTVNSTGRLEDKEGIQTLVANEEFSRTYSIEVF